MSETKDIAEELDAADAYNRKHYERDPLHAKAAAEIRRLRAINADLVGVLEANRKVLEWATLNRRKLGPMATQAQTCLHRNRDVLDRAGKEGT